LEARARAVSVGLSVNVHSPLPDVCIDRLRIQLVLFSQVQNALDASTQNMGEQVRVEICADRYSVETSITDSGPGISAESADKVFRPFFTTKPRGTGLGLAYSRASIEAQEGTIGFDRAQPTGCRFWFRLPIVSP
jgi:C4-dicarboxylate-specific signal transduction histidine kinase